MKRPLTLILPFAFCLAGLFSCERAEQPEEPVVLPPQREEALPYEQELSLVQLIPELESNPSIREENGAFFLPLGKQTWSETFQVDSCFIPAQTSSPVFLTAESSTSGSRTWTLYSTEYLAIKYCLPKGCRELGFADCPATFRLHLSLDGASSYRKVFLSELSIQFPSWLRAAPVGGSIPAMTLTEEGADIEFSLTNIYEPTGFTGEDGTHYLSAQTTFYAQVTASAEDALSPSNDSSAPIRLRCSFDSDRIDFGKSNLIYSDLEFPGKELKGEPVALPSFLTGTGSDVSLTGPQILIRYTQGFPFRASFEGAFPDLKDSPSFQLTSSGNYLLLPRQDGWSRPGIIGKEVSALQELFRKPAPDGTLTPRMTVRPVVPGTSMIAMPGKEYSMDAEAEWTLPISFTGKMAGISVRTETLNLDGDELDAPGAGTHEIGMTFANYFPFDCVITPVFTLEGNSPVFLDDLVVKGWRGFLPWFHYAFNPGKDHWKASLYFIITPAEGLGMQFNRSHNLTLKDARITVNVREES